MAQKWINTTNKVDALLPQLSTQVLNHTPQLATTSSARTTHSSQKTQLTSMGYLSKRRKRYWSNGYKLRALVVTEGCMSLWGRAFTRPVTYERSRQL
jgi:hypothetical protein